MTEIQRFTSIMGEISSLYHEAAFRLRRSDSTMSVLYTLLCCDGRCNISEICQLSGMRKQTLNTALRRLEAEGLICLEQHGGKMKTVHLTETGLSAAKETAGTLLEIEQEILSSWTQDEVKLSLNLAERYTSQFRQLVKELPVKPQIVLRP